MQKIAWRHARGRNKRYGQTRCPLGCCKRKYRTSAQGNYVESQMQSNKYHF